MQTSTDTALRRALKTLVLKGYGWKRRKRRESVSGYIEWRDPATGQWHAEKTALRLLKKSLLAEYAKPDSPHYRCYF